MPVIFHWAKFQLLDETSIFYFSRVILSYGGVEAVEFYSNPEPLIP